ncbi:hypothetical protein D3C71_835830 [compost metagenome]
MLAQKQLVLGEPTTDDQRFYSDAIRPHFRDDMACAVGERLQRREIIERQIVQPTVERQAGNPALAQWVRKRRTVAVKIGLHMPRFGQRRRLAAIGHRLKPAIEQGKHGNACRLRHLARPKDRRMAIDHPVDQRAGRRLARFVGP